MDNETVVFDDVLNGERVQVTLGMILNHPKAEDLMHGAVLRAINSASTNKADDESAAHAKLRRAKQIIGGDEWSRGGGHTLSESERARRDILASYATTHANLKRTMAEERARKEPEKLLSETATAIIKREEGKTPGKERLQNGVEKLRQVIDGEVQKRLAATSSEISI